MAWLGSWAKRRGIGIDYTNGIGTSVTHFPVILFLGTAVGTGDTDVSGIFDEVGTSSKKIALTQSDGTTELHGEIELWDVANSAAVIHVSSSAWVVDADTSVYIYYDSSQSDNTNFIGDPNDTAAEKVWDSTYIGVWHLAGSGTSTCYDSTSNNNDIVTETGTPDYQQTGKVNYSVNFSGSGEHLEINDSNSLDITQWTLECWGYPDTSPYYEELLAKRDDSDISYYLEGNSDEFGGGFHDGTDWRNVWTTDSPVSIGAWNHYLQSFDGTYIRLYLNGTWHATSADFSAYTPPTSTVEVVIAGNKKATEYPYDGRLDEVRISNAARETAWIEGSYHSGQDALLAWGSEETPPVGTPSWRDLHQIISSTQGGSMLNDKGQIL